MNEEDPLDYEVTVRATLEEKGLQANVRSRALAAFDRLLGAAVDIPGAWLENISSRRRLRGAIERKLIEAQGNYALAQIASEAEVGQVLVDEFMRKEARKATNKEAVILKSVEHINDHSDIKPDDVRDVDADWLNHFEDVAEKATSERMRDLWGRVLAGEIRKPGTFSLSTIRFLQELDAEIARVFGKIASRRFPEGLIAKPNEFKGKTLHEMSFLEEVGLLQEVFGHLGVDATADESGIINYRCGNYILRLKAERIRLHSYGSPESEGKFAKSCRRQITSQHSKISISA